jgi:ABC-type transporter Mla MlaB component
VTCTPPTHTIKQVDASALAALLPLAKLAEESSIEKTIE